MGGNSPNLGVLLFGAVLVQLGFGVYPVVLKEFSKDHKFNTVVFSFARDFFCFPTLLSGAVCLEKKVPKQGSTELNVDTQAGRFSWFIRPRHRYDVALFLCLGFLGCWGNQLFYILGLYCTTPDIAAIWQPTIPVWTVLVATALGLEPLPRLNAVGVLKVLGICFAIIGAIVMNLAKDDGDSKDSKNSSSSNPALGNVFFILNTFCQAIYIILQKIFIFDSYKSEDSLNVDFEINADVAESDQLGSDSNRQILEPLVTDSGENSLDGSASFSSDSTRYTHGLFTYWKDYPIHVTAWSYMAGAVYMAISCFIGAYFHLEVLNFERGTETDTLSLPKEAIIPLIYAVLVSSALCYGLITWLNKYIPASVVTSFWPFQIPVAVGLSYLLGLGSITALQTVGGVTIALGLICVSLSQFIAHRKVSSQLE